MKFTRTALALALALGTTSMVAMPALAKDKKEEAKGADRQYNFSAGGRKAIGELQAAIATKDAAKIQASLTAAQAAAKTNDDKYIVAKLQLAQAAAANDSVAIKSALSAIVASGSATNDELGPIYVNLGKLAYNDKDYAGAAAAFGNALKYDPNNVDAIVLSGEALNATGQPAQGVAMIQKAIATRVAAGQKPEENWYKRSVALAQKAKLGNVNELSREWLKAYPTSQNWRDALRIYQSSSGLDDASLIDSMRLAAAANALSGESDYFRLSNTLMVKGFPGEAKAILEQGFAANSISKSKATFAQLYTLANAKSQGDQASLAASAKVALAAPTAKQAMTTGDAYYGYGDYAKAADLYRAALTKSGADKDLANLRLGMALARAGDKAGAQAALSAAGGAQAEVAKFWLLYLATKA